VCTSAQPGTGGHGHATHRLLQACAVALDVAGGADAVAVLDQVQADGVGLLLG